MTALSLNHHSLKYDFNARLSQVVSNSWNVQKDFFRKRGFHKLKPVGLTWNTA